MFDFGLNAVARHIVLGIISLLVITALRVLIGWLLRKWFLSLHQRLIVSGINFIKRIYVRSFLGAIKRNREIHILSCDLNLRPCIAWGLFIFVAMYLYIYESHSNTFADAHRLIQQVQCSPGTNNNHIGVMEKSLREMNSALHSMSIMGSPWVIYSAVSVLAIFITADSILQFYRLFNATLEVQLKRLSENIRILSSKSELAELAILECKADDEKSCMEYLKKINEVSLRHGIGDLSANFKTVNLLKGIAESTEDSPTV